MSEPTKQAVLGLGDGNIDPDILTKEIDHDFFDNPTAPEVSGGFQGCQAMGEEMKFSNAMPNYEGDVMMISRDASDSTIAAMRLGKDEGLGEAMEGIGSHEDSGRSSSNFTVHLELRKDGMEEDDGASQGAVSEDFYSIQSNANYPRPKESYQLQQRRRSFGTIQQPQKSSSGSVRAEQAHFQPMNPSDCGLNGGHLDDNTDSSSSSAADDEDDSDSDLSDSSESELESLDTDDEEFVDMLEKYFDYIDPDSDCSDLTEVSPLSSLAASPLPPSFFAGLDASGGVPCHSQLSFSEEHFQARSLFTDAELCSAASNLRIDDDDDDEDNDEDDDDIAEMMNTDSDQGHKEIGLGSRAEIGAAVAAVTAVASAVPVACQLLENDMLRGGKPRLPMVISTTETVIIPAPTDSTDRSSHGLLTIPRASTGSANFDIPSVGDVTTDSTPDGNFGERDPRKDTKELDVCFNCCVMEHAKKILSREASPSRRNMRWLKQDEEEGNGNNGENGNSAEEAAGSNGQHKETARGRGTWKGKLRAGSSTSATSSSSSTTGSTSTTTFGSGLSGESSSSSTGASLKRAQKNYTFTPEQMRKIERENHVLLRKILDTHQKGFHHGHHGNHCHHHRCKNSGHHHHVHTHQSRAASTSIARLRQQKRIDHENTVSFIFIF